jgi:putative sigma-54 modulation protein
MNQKSIQGMEQEYDISITGRHVQVTESMKEYASEKIRKIERFTHHIIDVSVTMDIQKMEHKVDLVFKFGHFKIRASASTEDMYGSIDRVIEKILSQLRKWKSKIQNHHANGVSSVDMNVNVIRRPSYNELEQVNDEIDEENLKTLENTYKPHDVVKRETRPLKILTPIEAVMKMELSGDSFMLYKSEIDQKIKLIYRREDECYGIIEPE